MKSLIIVGRNDSGAQRRPDSPFQLREKRFDVLAQCQLNARLAGLLRILNQELNEFDGVRGRERVALVAS